MDKEIKILSNDNLSAMIVIGVAVLGLFAFVINWIRCRFARNNIGDFDEDEPQSQKPLVKDN